MQLLPLFPLFIVARDLYISSGIFEISTISYSYLILKINCISYITILELTISPFKQFIPNYIPTVSEISFDSYNYSSCVDLIFIIDVSGSINSTKGRIAEVVALLDLSSANCTNRLVL